jgi:oxygen-independent coproporphyrinogen-3 oxidase
MADDTAFSLLKQRSIGTSRVVFHPTDAIAPPSHTHDSVRSLYIHIPFCSHKCHYCDFYSIVDTRDRQEAFVSRLVRELKALSPFATESINTIFIGGGTPSLLRPDLWQQLLHVMHDQFDLSSIAKGEGEFSVECNPETVTGELAGVLREGGVNRASLGAQSFNTNHLKTLERWHDPDRVSVAIDTLQRAGINRCSLDLIYAIPGQSMDEWDADLRTALSMPIEHLSAYGLTYEPGTAMTARLVRGEFTQSPDDLEADMYRHALSTLRDHGFARYEVSNHAKPGAQCDHNMAYWRQHDWLAIGPSASGHFRGHRWKNTPRLDDYLNKDEDGFAPICDHEAPDTRRELMDLLMTSIRLSKGVDALSVMRTADGLDASNSLQSAAIMCADQGWLKSANAERWVLTDEGFLFADRVAREFIGALIVDELT